MGKGTVIMKLKKIHANYHIDLNQELFWELRINFDRVNSKDADSIVCELWIVNIATEEKWMREYDFQISLEDGSITDLFDHNLDRITSRYRKEGLPAFGESPQEYRWLYYKKELAAVLTVLRQWGHARIELESQILLEGEGEIGYRYHSAPSEPYTEHEISLDGDQYEAYLMDRLPMSEWEAFWRETLKKQKR